MHRGTLVVSLDFELFWGVRDRRTLSSYGSNLLGSRDVIPRLLELFQRFDVRATWATVGLLCFDDKEQLLAALPSERPTYRSPGLSPYPHIDAIGPDERRDPMHFGASLVRQIVAAKGQELATHTFSHYLSLEPGQTSEQFAADLDAAVATAARYDTVLRSIVFPRNEVNSEYLPLCSERGLVAFRGTQRAWMHSTRAASSETSLRRGARLLDAYLPLSRPHSTPGPTLRSGMFDVPASRFLRPRSRRLAALEPRKVARIAAEIAHAARLGHTFHLWWHPHNFGVDQEDHLRQLERLLERFGDARERFGMRSLTMAEVAAAAESP